MEETILVPSPNWFDVSILGAANDGWVVYGGPNKSLVVLEPVPQEYEGAIAGDQRFKAHVTPKAHREKISSVDISPEWPEKRHFITGSPDGTVKEWSITKEGDKCVTKILHSNEVHANNKEDVAGIGYATATHAISVGTFSTVTKWELATNLVKSYSNFMHNFRATCLSCSPHMPFHIAVGTRQGVIFVLDLNGNGKLIYKVRGQDDEITQLSWCPQYEVMLKRSFDDSRKKTSLSERLEKVQNEPQPEDLETSGVEKKLPDDSFDGSVVVPEDDIFDIYKDHEADEFGHKKYVPEDIIVREKADPVKDDFLAECEKLKADILKKKQEDDMSLESLVEAMDKAHVRNTEGKEILGDENISKEMVNVSTQKENLSENTEEVSLQEGNSSKDKSQLPESAIASTYLAKVSHINTSSHIQKHLLASIGKCGSLRIWSKTGKIVSSCSIIVTTKPKFKQPQYCTLCWYKPESLLFSDGKSNLLICNPLCTDSKNKLTPQVVHSEHRRGLYCIQTNAPRVQTDNEWRSNANWCVWTAAQDRYLVKYNLEGRKTLAKIGSCGGHLYEIISCPYDVGKIAVGVGDGAVRVWETHTSEDESKFMPGSVSCYWQHVLGKVLACAWHPFKENLLAFSTAESRVGLIDIGSKGEKPARVLKPGVTSGIYSLCWAEGFDLIACGGNEAVIYQTNKPDAEPVVLPVVVEGQPWKLSTVAYCGGGRLAAGSAAGGVALLTLHGEVRAAKFVCTKLIHMIDWHPKQTSSSDNESQYKDLSAVCGVDRDFAIVILQYGDKEGGGKQFTTFNTLRGHKEIVYKVYWSPHCEEQLLSASYDCTVRVWDAVRGECLSIIPGQGASTACAWAGAPALARAVLAGGVDCCLRLWDSALYPAADYRDVKLDSKKKRRTNKKKNKKEEAVAVKESDDDKQDDDSSDYSGHNVAGNADYKKKLCKKFLLPLTTRQVNKMNMHAVTTVLQDYIDRHNGIEGIKKIFHEQPPKGYDVNFLKIFGSINDVNEWLDLEAATHLQLKNYESYIMLLIFRGEIESVIQIAHERDMLDPFLLNVALCVSVKFWKDASKLYVNQMDRMAAKGEDDKIFESRHYGGVPFRKAVTLLSMHDVMGALEALKAAAMHKEAYILCRIRHMDSVAQDVLRGWAVDAAFTGNLVLTSVIYIALDDIPKAASVLRRSTRKECLALAGELAKGAGLPTFADFMETKAKIVEKYPKNIYQTEELLEELPTKIELLMKEHINDSEHTESKANENGDTSHANGDTIPQSEE